MAKGRCELAWKPKSAREQSRVRRVRLVPGCSPQAFASSAGPAECVRPLSRGCARPCRRARLRRLCACCVRSVPLLDPGTALPATVEDRAVPGHWGGDLTRGQVLGDWDTGGANEAVYDPVAPSAASRPRRSATSQARTGACGSWRRGRVRDAIRQAMVLLPEQLRRSLTWDQGTEMSQHVRLSIDTGLRP